MISILNWLVHFVYIFDSVISLITFNKVYPGYGFKVLAFIQIKDLERRINEQNVV